MSRRGMQALEGTAVRLGKQASSARTANKVLGKYNRWYKSQAQKAGTANVVRSGITSTYG